MAGVKCKSYLNKHDFKTAFKGWEGTGKLDAKGYVVPNFRFKKTKQPFSVGHRKFIFTHPRNTGHVHI